MSHTVTPGLVRASRYTFVAAATAAAIRDRAPIPPNVHAAALNLLRLAVEGVEDRDIPSDPVAVASANALAVRIAWSVAPMSLGREGGVDAVLRRHAATLEAIGPGLNWSEVAVEDLDGLAAFFDRLAEVGESESYDAWCGGGRS
jgi:hypothetical protein